MVKQTGGFMSKLAVPLGFLGLKHLYTKKGKTLKKSKRTKNIKKLKTLRKRIKSRRNK